MKKVDNTVIETYKEQISEENKNTAYPEILIIQQFGSEDEQVNINMNLLGLDLSIIPSNDLTNYKALIIPALYVLTTFISIKLTNNMQNSKNRKEDNTERDEMDAVLQANKSMNLMMPIMSVMIAIVAPLGLALYWLTNNILMIIERLVLNKFFNNVEEED
jgi:membrane protein insertase Oxa1/YidC/SpoIIIJ